MTPARNLGQPSSFEGQSCSLPAEENSFSTAREVKRSVPAFQGERPRLPHECVKE